jgi:competence protein ComEA
MAIEDFEWEGDLERALPAATPASPRAAASWFSRLKKSVWLEPALRLGGTALLLAVLAGIGVVATTYAKPGLPLPDGSRSLVAALGTSWLKPTASSAPVTAAPAPVAAAPALAAAAPSALAEPLQVPIAEPAPDAGAARGITADGKVVLNVASADELTQLPGIGMKRAQAIVALRTKLKRFKHPTDLLRVKGIGPRGLQRMLPHLVLDSQ